MFCDSGILQRDNGEVFLFGRCPARPPWTLGHGSAAAVDLVETEFKCASDDNWRMEFTSELGMRLWKAEPVCTSGFAVVETLDVAWIKVIQIMLMQKNAAATIKPTRHSCT